MHGNQFSKDMLKLQDGTENNKYMGVFFGGRNDKGTQRLFFQCRGGADGRNSGYFVRFKECQPNQPMGGQ
jgi:hypothetical protein